MICSKKGRALCVVLILCAAFVISSCSHNLGYGALLWSLPENGLHDGDIVRVYIKSNISQVYVIGLPDSPEKIEVPFWQITEPDSRKNTAAAYENYAEYQGIYARVASDGLPIRYEPVNTSRQVYRLRKGEELKVLRKGEGVKPTNGKTELEGDWLWVMTRDGSTGWCFSYNLRLYNEDSPEDADQEVEAFDETLDAALSATWYPDSYRAMINSAHIDLDAFAKNYRFDTGYESGTIQLDVADLSKKWEFKGTTKVENGVYRFNDAPLVMTVRRNDFIVLQYTDENGMPRSYSFVTIDTPLDEIQAAEEERRAALFERILAFGPSFASSNYGDLLFYEGNLFDWAGYGRLVPSIIPAGSASMGHVDFSLFLDSSLSTLYDGVVTLTFAQNGKRVNFLYKLETNGIRFEETTGAVIKNNVVTERGSNALVLFFGKE